MIDVALCALIVFLGASLRGGMNVLLQKQLGKRSRSKFGQEKI